MMMINKALNFSRILLTAQDISAKCTLFFLLHFNSIYSKYLIIRSKAYQYLFFLLSLFTKVLNIVSFTLINFFNWSLNYSIELFNYTSSIELLEQENLVLIIPQPIQRAGIYILVSTHIFFLLFFPLILCSSAIYKMLAYCWV